MMLSDPGLIKYFGAGVEAYSLVAGAAGAIGVMALGELVKRSGKKA
jgi:hypothetical protein